MSALLAAQCIVPCRSSSTIEGRIEKDCKCTRIHLLVPHTTFSMLILVVAVPALAFAVFGTIVGLFPGEAVARLRTGRMTKLVSPQLKSGVDFVAVQVVSVNLGGVAVLNDAKLLVAHSNQWPWLGETRLESAGTSSLDLCLLSKSIVDHDGV